MITWEQVSQRKLKSKEIIFLTAKGILILSVFWAALFYLLIFWELPFVKLTWFANGIQLLSALVISVLGIFYARCSQERYMSLSIALGAFTWTLGQFYWFSYIYLQESLLPQPTIADFGFISTYFFLIGVIITITNKIPCYLIDLSFKNLWPFAILAVPLYLALSKTDSLVVNIDNFAFALAIVCALWKAQPILSSPRYGVFLAGLSLLCICDILYMVFACCIPEAYTLAADALYPLALSLIVYGFMKAEEMTDV